VTEKLKPSAQSKTQIYYRLEEWHNNFCCFTIHSYVLFEVYLLSQLITLSENDQQCLFNLCAK